MRVMSSPGSPRDLYEILGVSKDATPQDIKKAFRAVARECHPDVAGHDAAKLDRFKRAKDAYDVLADPAARARYDRRNQPRTGGPFVGSHWQQGGVRVNTGGRNPAGGAPSSKANNDLDLEDIFNDFGGVDFGFGGPTRGQPSRGSPPPRPPPPKRERPEPGRDLSVAVDVPWEVAEMGGTVGIRYSRLRRADDGRTLYNYDELYDLKVPPGTRHGQTLRVEKMGDAGLHGGPYGELVCDVRVVGAPPKDQGRMKMPRREEEPTGDVLRVDISVTDAILGGRVTVQTPAGPVRVAVPAGTNSGTRMRLRGKGAPGADGTPGDLVAELRIVVPKTLDEESRRLIERFAELNPMVED
jgi:curved DNA-binding protein